MNDEQSKQTQSMILQTNNIITILSNDKVESTIQYDANNVLLQDDISNKEVHDKSDYSFNFKKFKFNNKPVFIIYAIITCVTLSQEILSSASFLELQLKKIESHSNGTKTSSEFLSYMKWSGIVFTILQMFSVYFFGSILDKKGVRFSALLFLLFYFLSNVTNLFLMSDYYNFDFYSYIFFRLIASLDGGFVVLATIMNAGITDLYEVHTQRMLYFNYLYSIVGVSTFAVPFFTTFIIKKYGNYCTLQLQTTLTLLNITFVYMLLNNKPRSTTSKDEDTIIKDQVNITTKKVDPVDNVLSTAEVIMAETNIIKNIIKQFEVFVLPKKTGVARKNVFLLETMKVLSSIDQATINVGVSYLMVDYNFNAIQLNYIISFFGCYGCFTSFFGIKLFYYIVNNFTKLKPSTKFFDRVDQLQLFINNGSTLFAFTLPIIFRKSWLGQIFMLFCFETFVCVGPILNNGIIKIIENEEEYVKLNTDEESNPLMSRDDNEINSAKPTKSKTAIILSCYTIQDKLSSALFSATLFQVLELTKDSCSWAFYVVAWMVSLIRFVISFLVEPKD